MEGDGEGIRANGSGFDSKAEGNLGGRSGPRKKAVANRAPRHNQYEAEPGAARPAVRRTEDERMLDRQLPVEPVATR